MVGALRGSAGDALEQRLQAHGADSARTGGESVRAAVVGSVGLAETQGANILIKSRSLTGHSPIEKIHFRN